MKNRRTYIIFVLLLSAALSSCVRKDSISLAETFSKNDKIPFGAYVLHKELGQFFPGSKIHAEKQKFSTTFNSIEDTASLYICVSKNFYSSNRDNEAILSYIDYGNDIFISSENIDENLLDTLGVELSNGGDIIFQPAVQQFPLKYTSVKMQPGLYADSSLFTYFYEPFSNYFSGFDSSKTKVLGRNESGQANFIVLFQGNGHIYLHSEPRALSNYFLLQKDNYKYMQHVFSFMPAVPQRIFWDDFYWKRNYPVSDNNDSGLSILFKYPALAKATWLLLLLVILYILFEGKRRQRLIPIIPPNKNTTVAFAETIGRLYLQKKNNRNMADKIIAYFLEHIRNRYYLNTNHIDANFIDTLSRKSNMNKEEIDAIFDFINTLQQEAYVTDHQLLILNGRIEKFFKNKI